MNLFELDPKLSYHKELNQSIWEGKTLRAEVKTKLNEIIKTFLDKLELPSVRVKDIVFTGSMANYNWTQLSDIDIHVLVDMNIDCEPCDDDFIDAKSCLDAKRAVWNDRHDITVYGFPVELYVSDYEDEHITEAGIYSLSTDKWLKEAEFKNISIDSGLIKTKAEVFAVEIDELVSTKVDNPDTITTLVDRLYNYRKSGLQNGGEYSVENLSFKALRNNGYTMKLLNYANKILVKNLSLESLDSKVDSRELRSTANIYHTEATIGNRVIKSVFSKEHGESWDYEFSEKVDNKWTTKTTGSGSEFRVFAFVKNSFSDFISMYAPEEITFSATEENGSTPAKVYDKMTKGLKNEYNVSKTIADKAIQFTLTRK